MKIKKLSTVTGKVPGWFESRFKDHYAQISVDVTLKLKSAIKDVARVLEGKVSGEIEAITKALPTPPQGITDKDFVFGYEDSGNWHSGLIDTNDTLRNYVKNYPKHWDIVQKSLGLKRASSRHAAGYIITNKLVGDFIPLTTVSDVICTAFTPSSVEKAGGIKWDMLVVNALNDISECLRLIQERNNIPKEDLVVNGLLVPKFRLIKDPKDSQLYDIWDMPEHKEVFDNIVKGKNETVFQLNTPGAYKWLKYFSQKDAKGKHCLQSIRDIATFTALDRPGPLDVFVENPENGSKHNALVEYTRRRTGREPSTEIPDFMNKLFPDTYGLMVTQEQLQYAYQDLTDCSGSEAEQFRRDVAKKKLEKILKVYPAFIERAGKKLGSKERAEFAFEFFKTWSKYGFCKSHAHAYGIIAYATAYLKHFYPLEWWTSVLRNADKDEIAEKFWPHCGHMIDMPDINKSFSNFEIVGSRIMAPTSLLHGIGEKAHEQLLKYGPYSSVEEFCSKIEEHKVKTSSRFFKNGVETVKKGHSSLNRGVVYKLIISGTMDRLFPSGLSDLEKLAYYEEKLAEATKTKQASVEEKYLNLNAFTKFQFRKKILPAFTADLTEMIVQMNLPDFKKTEKRMLYSYDGVNYPVINGVELQKVDQIDPFPPDAVKAVVVGYVTSTKPFSFTRDGVTKKACEFNIDLNGYNFQSVKWGDRRGNLDPKFEQNLDGTIAAFVVSKYRTDKPFAIENLIILQKQED